MHQPAIMLNRNEQNHYEQEIRTSDLVQLSYRYCCRGSKLTPEKIFALCQLTWWKGKKAPVLWTLWNKKTPSPATLSDVCPQDLPKPIYHLIQEEIGIANYYAAFRNSSLSWIRRHKSVLIPLVHRAAALRTPEEAEALAEIISQLPSIPRPSRRGGEMPPQSLLTPLVACLDPRRRFPIINKAKHVVELHRKQKIAGYKFVDKYKTLVGFIGQCGITDALMMDAASKKIPKLNAMSAKPQETHELQKIDHRLDEKSDQDVEYLVKSRTRTAMLLHNTITNKLLKYCSQRDYSVFEGSDRSRYDALIKDYDRKGKDLLIEVKSSADRSQLRLAVGQLFDYRRSLKRRLVTDLAVLLPRKPDKESIRFLNDVGIHILWFHKNSPEKILGNINWG